MRRKELSIGLVGRAARRMPIRRAELAGHAGHRGPRPGSYAITVELPTWRPCRRIAGDGRRRDRRQCVGHRGRATPRRNVLRRGPSCRWTRTSTCPGTPPRGRPNLTAGIPAHRTRRTGRPTGDRRLKDGSKIPMTRTGRYPDHRRGAVVTRRRGQQGQCRCAARHHRGGVQRGRRPRGKFADLVPRLAELTTSLDRQTNDIIAAVEGLNRFAAILARGKDNLAARWRPCRGAGGAQRESRPTSSTRSPRCRDSRGPVTGACHRPRRTSPQTSRTSIR